MTDDRSDRPVGRHSATGLAAPPGTPTPAAVVARGLVKTYKDVVALDGVDLTVPQGTVLGLLGPNGAGKTTTVRILTTLLQPDSGSAEVAGLDVLREPRAVRRRIGLSGQYAAVDEYLTGYENLEMIGRLYHLGKAKARERARELLAQFRLEDAADRPSRTYSGGMRRRLDLAGALVAGGTTLLLTTQYLEEADVLADDIVVIDHGKVIAQGTADELKLQVGGERLELTVADETTLERTAALLEPLGVGKATLEPGRRSLLMPVTGGARTLTEALRVLDDAGIALDDVGLRRPTLDDVFLTLTGRPAEDDETESKGDA